MILLNLDSGTPAFCAMLMLSTISVLFNLPPFLGYRKSSILLALYFVPLFFYIVFLAYYTIISDCFYWSFRGDFLIIALGISLLNLLIITLRREGKARDIK